MRVQIDLDYCEGHGRCHAAAPDLFRLDDDGFAADGELEVPPDLEHSAADGAGACPMGIIHIVEGTDG